MALDDSLSEDVPIDNSETIRSPVRRKHREKDIPPADPLLASVQRIEKLLEVLVRRSLQPILDEETKGKDAAAIYAATGHKTVREIAEQVGLGTSTVSRLWVRWEGLGLVVKDGIRYRRAI